MPKSTINGVQLFWERTGDAGEPLVLVHGSWVDHHTWDAVVPILSQTFRVLTYDRRGHSQSERPKSQGSIREDVDDLAALVKALDFAPAHIIGSSFGGCIVLRLASEHPDLFQSMSVNEPPLLSLIANDPNGQKMLQGVQEQFSEIKKHLESGDMEGGVRLFVEKIVFGPGAWEHIPPALKKIVTFNAPTFLDELRDPEAFVIKVDRLRTFSQPALLTIAEQGAPFMPLIVDKLTHVLPKAEERVISGASHEPESSQPEAYAALIKEFVTQVSSPVPR